MFVAIDAIDSHLKWLVIPLCMWCCVLNRQTRFSRHITLANVKSRQLFVLVSAFARAKPFGKRQSHWFKVENVSRSSFLETIYSNRCTLAVTTSQQSRKSVTQQKKNRFYAMRLDCVTLSRLYTWSATI